MPRNRPFRSMPPWVVYLALVVGIAWLGWVVGQRLPIWPASTARTPAESSNSSARPEASLDEQIAAVELGESATIQIETQPIDRGKLAQLRRLTNLQVLLLDHPENAIDDDDCGVPAGLSNLVHLRIRGGAIGDAGLAHLARLPHLKILNLPQSRISDRGLSVLAEMPQLMQLRLGSRQITDAGIKELSRFSALRQLHLIDAPITDAALEEVARLDRLESLYLDGSRITDAGLVRLFRARPKLHVHINQQHHDRDPRRGHE